MCLYFSACKIRMANIKVTMETWTYNMQIQIYSCCLIFISDNQNKCTRYDWVLSYIWIIFYWNANFQVIKIPEVPPSNSKWDRLVRPAICVGQHLSLDLWDLIGLNVGRRVVIHALLLVMGIQCSQLWQKKGLSTGNNDIPVMHGYSASWAKNLAANRTERNVGPSIYFCYYMSDIVFLAVAFVE